jgi:hypothetical protein
VIAYERYISWTAPPPAKHLALDRSTGSRRRSAPLTSAGNAGCWSCVATHRTSSAATTSGSSWGWEDWAIADALETLVHPQVRVPGYVLHFCHPRDRDRSKRQGEALAKRYTAAHGDREAMLAILAEEGRRS